MSANRLARLAALLVIAGLVCVGIFLWALMHVPAALSPDAARTSEIARNVAVGRGFMTQVTYPVALGLGKPLGATPEVSVSPGLPGLLAITMRLRGASDIAIIYLACVGLMVCAGCTLLAVTRVSDRLTGYLAAGLILLNVQLLERAANGSGACWAIAFVAAALLGLTMMTKSAAASQDLKGIRARLAAGYPCLGAALAGLAFGLAYLTEYALLWGGLVFLWYVWNAAEKAMRRRALCCVLGGFAVVVVPWWVRNVMVAGWPWFLLDRYAAMGGSDAWPGTTIFRTIADPGSPYLFLLRHPKALVTNLMQSAAGIYGPLAATVGPLLLMGITLPFLVKVPDQPDRRWHRLLAALFGITVLTTAATTAFSTSYYLALLPVACVAGARAFVGLIRQCAIWPKRLLTAALALTLVAPILTAPPASGGSQQAAIASNLQDIGRELPENVLFITDVPELVAWYTQCPTVWLPTRQSDLTAILQSYPGPVAFFLSRNIAQAPPSEQLQPYQTLLLQPPPEGLSILPLPLPGDRMLVPTPPQAEGEGETSEE